MLRVRPFLPILIWMSVCFAKVDSACYSNTNDILSTLRSASAQLAKEFVLCPATEFSIGSLTSNAVDGHHENDYTGGTAPLMARSNTHYKCGDSGSSDNGCIVKGGDVQFWSHEDTFDEDESLSVVVQGITFQDAQFVAILLENAGTITFIDCIIQNHFNAAPVIASYSSLRRLQYRSIRHLQDSSVGQVLHDALQQLNDNSRSRARKNIGGHRRRRLSTYTGKIPEINFDNCQFVGNQQRDPPALFTYGVITVSTPFHELNVVGCTFVNNVYNRLSANENCTEHERGYLIRSWGSELHISDSSFVNNTVESYGVVEAFSIDDNDMVTVSNNVGLSDLSNSGAAVCPFLAISETIPELDRQVACQDYDG